MAWKRQLRAPLIRALLPFLVIYLYLPSAVAWEIRDVPALLEKTLILAYTLVVAFRDFLNTADFRSMYEAAYYPSPTPSPAASPAPDFEHRLGLPHWDRYTTFSFGAGIAAVAFLPLLVRIACSAHARASANDHTDIDARTDANKPQPSVAAPGTSVPSEGEHESADVAGSVHACANTDADANDRTDANDHTETDANVNTPQLPAAAPGISIPAEGERENADMTGPVHACAIADADANDHTDADANARTDTPQPPAAAPGTSVLREGEREDAAMIRLVHACADIDADASEKYASVKAARVSVLTALRRRKSNIPDGRQRRAFSKAKWAIAKK